MREIFGLPLIGSLVVIALSIPLIFGMVKPNGLYGYRTKKTVSNSKIWYAANRFTGLTLLLAGCVTTLLSMMFIFSNSQVSTLILVAPYIVAILCSMSYVKKLS